MAVFWDIVQCSLTELYRRLRGSCCVRHQGNHTRSNIIEDVHLRTYRRENLKYNRIYYMLLQKFPIQNVSLFSRYISTTRHIVFIFLNVHHKESFIFCKLCH